VVGFQDVKSGCMKSFAVVLLAVVLTLASIQSGFAGTWLSYGTGSSNDFGLTPPGSQAAVLFDLPAGWSCANVLAARFYLTNSDPQGLSVSFPVHVYDATLGELTPPGTTGTAQRLPASDWVYVYFSGITVMGEFYVSIEAPASPSLSMRFLECIPDCIPDSHSYWGVGGPLTWSLLTDQQYTQLQAEVDQCPSPPAPPVGGFVMPVNKFTVVAPYLALLGLVAVVTIVVVAPWKKRDK